MDNKLEKLFCVLLENWFALKLIAGDDTCDVNQRFSSNFAAGIIDDCLKEAGFGTDTSDYVLEKLQIKFNETVGESA